MDSDDDDDFQQVDNNPICDIDVDELIDDFTAFIETEVEQNSLQILDDLGFDGSRLFFARLYPDFKNELLYG